MLLIFSLILNPINYGKIINIAIIFHAYLTLGYNIFILYFLLHYNKFLAKY